MAELPRYRRDGLLSAVSPGFEGVGLREAARASETLTRAMDRVSQMAFQVAGEQAKIEGIEYGAANAPTVEQLAKAKEQGKDIKEILPGDTFSIFGQAARATAIDMLTSTMETQARESIVGIQTRYELGQIDLAGMQENLTTIEDTYSAILSDIDPVAASRFRATIGLAGNSAFLSAAKSKVKADKKAMETLLAVGVQAMIDSVPTIVDAGVTKANDGSIVTPNDSINVLRAQIQKYGSQMENGDTFIRENLRILDQRYNEALVGNVADWVMEDPIKHTNQIMSGTIKDAGMNALVSSMTTEQIRDAKKAANDQMTAFFGRENQLYQRNERLRGELFDALVPQLFDAKATGRDEDVESILMRMADLKPVEATSMREAIYTTGGIDNAEVVTGLDLLSTQGALTLDLINEKRADKEISESTYRRYLGAIEQQRNTDHNEALTFAENILRPGVRGLINPGADDRKALKKLGELENAMILEARKNPGYDRLQYAQDWLNNQNKGPTAAEIEQARAKISGLAQFVGLSESASPEEVKAALAEKVADGSFNAQRAAAYDASFGILGVE